MPANLRPVGDEDRGAEPGSLGHAAGDDGRPAAIIGVPGAGTMGAGIAQLAARAGAQTLLYDPIPDALARGRERVADGLRREASKGRLTGEQAAAAQERLAAVDGLPALA